MKKIIALVLVISFIVAVPGDLVARERRGAELIIETKDDHYKGELIAVKKNSLLILESDSGLDVSIEKDKIKRIRVIKIGILLLSGSLGAIIGHSLGGGSISAPIFFSKEWGIVFGLVGGLALGILIISIIKTTENSYETIQIEGKPEAEIEDILEKLSKKALIPDYR